MIYDVIVIGAGPAGKNSSIALAKEGKKVCLIEKFENHIGGTCLNEGCIPAKLYLESVSYLGKKAYLESCGLKVEKASFDMSVLNSKKETLLDQLRNSAETNIKKSGIDMIFGEAVFESENSILVNGESIKADKFIIAAGSTHRPHPLLSVDKKQIISSDEVFELEKIPSSIIVVGGGAIGCEFATFFNSLGTKVHIVEFTPNLVPAEDGDVSSTLKRELERKGIKVSLDTNVTSFEKKENRVILGLQTSKGEASDEAELVLVSIGRIPNTQNLKLENAKVDSERGFVTVDENLRTTNPNVYALGDVIPTPALAHVAYDEAKVVANNILGKTQIQPSPVIPFVTFCQPQVASVGLHEKELKAKNIEYEVIKSFFKSSAKAKIKGYDGGFIKLFCEKESGVILGGAMIGNDTTELIHEILIAVNKKLTKKDLRDMVFAHPTLSESLWAMLQ
ncbi:MAG: dihydrolipoyl dehydrogenase [Sulfurospirillaceae bacterium]|nr:dihydrolipoyl dehydrogenase [Sulfurospirillaceae bacterium]